MPSKTALNLSNLQALGAERLARIVLDLAAGDANAKRRLRMELTGEESVIKLSNSIRKRLASIAASDRYVGWRSIKSFIADLDTQRRFIRERIAPVDVSEALDLSWSFLSLSNGVLERITDPTGEVLGIFQCASSDIIEITNTLVGTAERATDSLVEAVKSNFYGQSDGLILGLADRLGPRPLLALRDRLRAAQYDRRSSGVPGRFVSRWKSGRIFERGTVPRRPPEEVARLAEEEIADALGDVDTYIALQPDVATPGATIRIAIRLIKVGRAIEALEWLDRVGRQTGDIAGDLARTRIAALNALGRDDEANTVRWNLFETELDAQALRDYLKSLPDFDDVEVEERAFAYVSAFHDASAALRFFIDWPALDRASALVRLRVADVDPRHTGLIQSAVDRLTARYPVAATLLLRWAITAILKSRHIEQYELARHMLTDAFRLSNRVANWAGEIDHETYASRLKTQFETASEFWQAVD